MGLEVGLQKIANSNIGIKFFKWSSTPKGQRFIDNNYPTFMTLASTFCYTASVENQKLDRRRKNLLHIQNIFPAVIGMFVGNYLNRKVSNFGDKIIEHLNPEQIPKMHKIVGATKFLLPILTTGLLMRLALPVFTAFASGEIEECKSKHQKLDVKV